MVIGNEANEKEEIFPFIWESLEAYLNGFRLVFLALFIILQAASAFQDICNRSGSESRIIW